MSSLEQSVTLDDVFAVVEAKRVPLAPELAGYLTLEIADGTDAGSGEVDPKTVFISEEGTVALVRPKKDSISGDAELSIRGLLEKLLDASGSGTPALTTAAKRKSANGLPALVEELEAALIPVNRAAGRRALARLSREVKRVLFGVGRNASVAPVSSRSEGAKSATSIPAPHARPAIRRTSGEVPSVPPKPAPRTDAFLEEAATAKRANELAAAAEQAAPAEAVSLVAEPAASGANEAPTAPAGTVPSASAGMAGAIARVGQLAPDATFIGVAPEKAPSTASQRPRRMRDATLVGVAPAASVPPGAGFSGLPGVRRPSSGAIAAPTASSSPVPPKADAAPAEGRPPSSMFVGDEVDSLLGIFGVSGAGNEKQVSRDLKAIAGLSPTPPPPDAKTLAELTKDVGKELPKNIGSTVAEIEADRPSVAADPAPKPADSVEALLALADASAPVAPIAPIAHSPLPPPVLPPVRASSVPPPAKTKAPEPSRDEAKDSRASAKPARNEAKDSRASAKPARNEAKDSRASAKPARAESKDSRPSVREHDREEERPSRKKRRTDGGPRAPKTGMAMLVLALLVLAAGTVAIWRFAPQVFTGKKKSTTAPVATSAPSAVPAPKCKVALVLTDVPANAEILLRVGQSPTDVERMPVGTRLELVATAEGFGPRRAVIKSETPWDKGPDGKPRFEVPIQLDPSKAKPGQIDAWPAAEPGSQVGGSGPPGTVHVVSNVRGAEVWLLAGLGPEARIDQLRCDSDIDVLLAGPPALRKRLHVGEKDIAASPPDEHGSKVITVSGH